MFGLMKLATPKDDREARYKRKLARLKARRTGGEAEKTAALNDDVKLHAHQQRFVDKPGDAVIAAHPVGAGKTLAGIARFEHLKEQGKAHHALVVTPSSLRDNFGREGVGKFTNSHYNLIGNQQERAKGAYHAPDPNADYNIVSYDLFRRHPQQYLSDTGADTLILDEFHRGKNEGTLTTDSLKAIKGQYKNLIGLTGSIVSNNIADVQPLVDVATSGEHRLGATKDEFEHRYLKRSIDPKYRGLHEKRIPVIGFKHPRQLQEELGRVIDYVDDADVKTLADMPDKHIHVVKVPLSREQARVYKGLLNQSPDIRKMIVQKRAETMRDDEVAKAFSQLMEARKLMNSYGSVVPGVSEEENVAKSPKLRQLMDDLQMHLKTTPDGQALLFSHLVNGGTNVMEEALRAKGIPYGKFIGKGNEGVSEESRQQDVRDYNAGKKRVMIVSPAGGEGLSLNDTTWEGVLDPHFNPERMKQMEARGVRSGGLSHRAPADRSVEINRYLATMPKTLGLFKSRYQTPDEFIYDIAQRKDKQNQMLYRLLQAQQEREAR